MPLKAVLFDLGLTIIRTLPFPEIYRRILSYFTITTSLENIIQAQQKTETEFETSKYDKKERKEFWTKYNAVLLKNLGIKDRISYIAEQIDVLWWKYSHLQVFSDVYPTLSRLRERDLKIGLVSNGFKKNLDYVLSELDLKQWFDVVVCIDSCNCAKPQKQIFLYALDKLGVESCDAIFIGDSVEQDYLGALEAGIRPYLIDREGKFSAEYRKISSLTEILTIF